MKLEHLVSVILAALTACACGDGDSLGKGRDGVKNTPDGSPAAGGTSGTGGSGVWDGAAGTGGCTGSGCPCDPDAEWWRYYVSRSPEECTLIDFPCKWPATHFTNACGCGCEQSGGGTDSSPSGGAGGNTPDGSPIGSGGAGGNTPDGSPIGSGGSGAAADGGPPGIPCWVDGIRYEHGARLKDPFSCRQATCDNGYVRAVTLINCPEPCPPGQIGTTRCAACGQPGGCGRYETGCFPVCSSNESCAGAGLSCVDGVCQASRCI